MGFRGEEANGNRGFQPPLVHRLLEVRHISNLPKTFADFDICHGYKFRAAELAATFFGFFTEKIRHILNSMLAEKRSAGMDTGGRKDERRHHPHSIRPICGSARSRATQLFDHKLVEGIGPEPPD